MRKLDKDLVEGIMFKSGWKPLEPYKNHRHRWKSECLICGKISTPTLKNVKKKGTGCGYCKKKKVDGLDAFDAMLNAGLLPKTEYVDSKKNWESECMTCGAIVSPSYNSIQRGQGGCENCGSKSRADKNRTERSVAFAMAKSRNLQPLEEYISRTKPWKCKCLICGNTPEPTLANMQRGSGCSYCANSGFNGSIPAVFYLILHRSFNSIKIGITNENRIVDRIKIHTRQGWELQNKYFFEKGDDAQHIELQVLKWLRKDLKLPIHLTSDMMPQNGHTETVSADSVTVIEIQNKIEEMIKDYKEK
jgi:hypothetical protein